MAGLTIIQRRSANGASRRQRDALRTLGLGRVGRSVQHDDTPAVRGVVRVAHHLVEVREG